MSVLYARFTDYRRARYRIMTSIESRGGVRNVVKKNAPGGRADAHLQRIAQSLPLLKSFYGGALNVCPCSYENEELVFPYVDGESLLEKMKRPGAFFSMLPAYERILTGPEDNVVPFSYTEAFADVFGKIDGLEGARALKFSNLDASPGNIIDTADGPVLIDYEWICDFPVPRDFVLFRHLRFLFSEPGFDWDASTTFARLLRACDVRMDLETLMRLYDAFQRHVCVEDGADLSCAEVFEKRRKPVYDSREGLFRSPRSFVFLDTGAGFNEQEKLEFPSADGDFEYTVNVENVRNIRFDPFGGQRTLTRRLGFVTDTGTLVPYAAPDVTRSEDRVIFNVPANITVAVPEGARTMTISGSMLFMGEKDEYWLAEANAIEKQKAQTEETLERVRSESKAREETLEAAVRQTQEICGERLARKEEEIDALRRAREEELASIAAQHAAEMANAERENAELSETVRAMRESTSWKMTGWLRKLGALGKK